MDSQDALVNAVTTLSQKVDATAEQLRDVRERLIRIESHESRIEKISGKLEDISTRLIVLETNGKTYAIGVAAAISIGFILLEKLILPLVTAGRGP